MLNLLLHISIAKGHGKSDARLVGNWLKFRMEEDWKEGGRKSQPMFIEKTVLMSQGASLIINLFITIF